MSLPVATAYCKRNRGLVFRAKYCSQDVSLHPPRSVGTISEGGMAGLGSCPVVSDRTTLTFPTISQSAGAEDHQRADLARKACSAIGERDSLRATCATRYCDRNRRLWTAVALIYSPHLIFRVMPSTIPDKANLVLAFASPFFW